MRHEQILECIKTCCFAHKITEPKKLECWSGFEDDDGLVIYCWEASDEEWTDYNLELNCKTMSWSFYKRYNDDGVSKQQILARGSLEMKHLSFEAEESTNE